MNVVLIAFSVPVNDLLVIENEREHIRVLIQTTYPGIALLYTRGRGRKYPKYMAFFGIFGIWDKRFNRYGNKLSSKLPAKNVVIIFCYYFRDDI